MKPAVALVAALFLAACAEPAGAPPEAVSYRWGDGELRPYDPEARIDRPSGEITN